MNTFHFHFRLSRYARFALLVAAGILLLLAPDAFAAGNNVGKNLGALLKEYAGEIYGGLAGITSLIFLWNRRYIELATFLVAALMVGWLVFAPSTIGSAAEAIAKQVF